MHARLLPVLVLAFVVAACGASPAPSPGTTPVTDPAGSPGPAGPAAFELRRAPAATGCDAIGVDYRSVTFRIDPAADEPVTALTDRGARLTVAWTPAFRPSPDGQPLVVDGEGRPVVADGQSLALPAAAWPRLAGYLVCAGPSSLTVLEAEAE